MNDSPPSLVSTQQTASNIFVLVHRLMVDAANAFGDPSTFASIWEEQVLCCRYPSLRTIAFSGQLVGCSSCGTCACGMAHICSAPCYVCYRH